MTGKFHRFTDVACPAVSSSVFSRFDHRSLLVVWGVFVLLLVSVDKFDIVRTLSFAAFPAFVIIATRIPPGLVVKRVALLSPFIIIMAAANPFLDREAIGRVGSVTLTSGMLSAAVIMVKATIALSAMILLDRAISINGLCNALRRLGVPAVFTTQLLLLHRYAFLIAGEAATMIRARDARSFGKRGKGPIDTAYLIGSLLLRSAERSERVYKAMLARGFSGTLPAVEGHHFGTADIVFISASVSAFTLLRFIF
jgi:cobalt/nickel transport system permease protein